MAKKFDDNATATETLLNAIDEIQKKVSGESGTGPLNSKDNKNLPTSNKIVDIITFCEDPRYLDLINNNFNLYISQRTILKTFYMGSIGNEDIKLDKKEWDWLYSNKENETIDEVVYEKTVDRVIERLQAKERGENNSPYFKELQLVLGRRSSKCHEINQLISTTIGSITYKELCNRLNKNEKIGICTYDQGTFKRSVTYDLKSKYNGEVECFEILTKRGKREISSWNHPYLIWRKEWDNPRFVQISELLPGDKIATAKCTELFGNGGIGVNKAAILGHLLGDGSIVRRVEYTTASKVMIDDFTKLIKEEFNNYNVKYTNFQYDYLVVKNSGMKIQDGSQKNKVKEWLISEGCFGKKSIEKEIPKSIYNGSKEEISAFLSRLFGCDGFGTVSKEVQKGHGGVPRSQVGYCSSSRRLIEGVQHLLLKYGIQSSVIPIKAKCNGKIFNSFNLHIRRTDDLEIFMREINIFSKEDKVKEVVDIARTRTDQKGEFDSIPIGVWNYINKVKKDRNLTDSDVLSQHGEGHNDRLRRQYSPHYNKIICYGESINDKFLKDIGNSDIKWDEIKSITPIGIRPTIALEVVGNNIIGGDIISHNTVTASIITAYEAYKLLIINNGDPHTYYNLPYDDEIAIINVALSEKQAGRLFGQVQSRIRNAPFFKGRIAKETTSEIRLYTDEDLRKKSAGANIAVNGSILLLCGHSNPDSLAGYNAILLLFDEIGFYDESGKVTGSYFYGRLKPSLAKFYKYNAARIVQISSPNKRNGIFYDTYIDAKTDDSILSYQLPTWSVNPEITYDNKELERDRKSNIDRFIVEYGAQWGSGGSYNNYFEEGLITRCIRGDICAHTRPMPGFNYYIHVDPAKKGNNYAAVMIAKERYVNNMGRKRNRMYLANIWVWRPIPGVGLIFNDIDRQMIEICSIFHPMIVSYDDYHSMHSLQLLKNHGINTKQLSYNRGVKQKIYQNLRDLMSYTPNSELFLYDDGGESSLLISELKNLKYRRITRGVAFVTDKYSEVKSDDLSDSIAGACMMANEGLMPSLPEPMTVYAPGLR